MDQRDDVQEQASVRTVEQAAGPIFTPKPRGFAGMDRTLVSELAKRGGKAAHVAGTAHEFTSDEARLAGRKGGLATHAKRQAKRADALAIKS
jgi:general stress protein YciG